MGALFAAPPENGDAADKPPKAKIEHAAALIQIEKLNIKEFDLARLKDDKKLLLSEYRVKGLWEELGMQLFRLARGDNRMANYLVFLYADGKVHHLKIPTHGSVGLLKAAVHEKSLYLTSDWGSGILRTALYRVGRRKGGGIQTEELGVLSSSPSGLVDEEFLKEETVIEVRKLLQPLRLSKHPAGQAGADHPAAAPEPKPGREADRQALVRVCSELEAEKAPAPQGFDLSPLEALRKARPFFPSNPFVLTVYADAGFYYVERTGNAPFRSKKHLEKVRQTGIKIDGRTGKVVRGVKRAPGK